MTSKRPNEKPLIRSIVRHYGLFAGTRSEGQCTVTINSIIALLRVMSDVWLTFFLSSEEEIRSLAC